MKYAIISSGSKQYKVEEGNSIEVDALKEEKGTYTFPHVLLFADEGKLKVGTPYVADAVVSGTILEKKKGVKVRTAKFKSKVRYRKVIGYRHTISVVKIDKISLKK